RNSAERVSFRAKDRGFASNGVPISCKAMCAAIELEPGAKNSVSMDPQVKLQCQAITASSCGNRQPAAARRSRSAPQTRGAPASVSLRSQRRQRTKSLSAVAFNEQSARHGTLAAGFTHGRRRLIAGHNLVDAE